MDFLEASPGSARSGGWLLNLLLSILGPSIGIIGAQQFGLFQSLDQAGLDHLAQWRPVEQFSLPIALVTITEADIAQQQQWPLSDASLATLLDQVQQAQPRVIGLNLYRDIAIEPGTSRLQQTLASMPNLIGVEKVVGDESSPAIAPNPSLLAQNQVAMSDLVLDRDGKVRRHLISLRNSQNEIRFSLGAQLALRYLADQGIEARSIADCCLQLGKARIRAITGSSGGYVRADVGGYQVLSNDLPLASIPRLTLQQVLAGEGKALMRDRIVIIGSTASSLQNRFYTSTRHAPGPGWSGLDLQADLAGQLVLAALHGRPFLQGLPDSLEWLWILLWSSLGAGVGLRLRSNRRFGLALGVGLVGLWAFTYCLLLSGWWVIAIAPEVAYLGSAIVARQSRLQRLAGQAQARLQAYSQTFARQLAQAVAVQTHALSLEHQEFQRANAEARQQIEAERQTKRELLAFIGHELRTPLNSIMGYGQLIASESALPDQYRSSINSINSNGEYLLKLVNDLLEFSVFETDKSSLNPAIVHLPSLIAQVENLFRLQAKKRHINFRCTGNNTLPDYVLLDEIKLRQILINLISNALRLTQSGHVILRAWGDGQMYFEVEDTGPGIPEDELPRIFEPFRKSDMADALGQRSSTSHNIGLGLWISESLVKVMGGLLTVRSTLGQGSTFRIALPLVPADSGLGSESVPRDSLTPFSAIEVSLSVDKLPVYRILVVDDVDVNRKILVKLLEDIGVEVREASSGEDAIVLWQTWQPQLILMDLYMPGIGGCEAIRRIRAQESPNQPPVPILAVTANAATEGGEAIEAGCQAVIARPIRREELLISITNQLDW